MSDDPKPAVATPKKGGKMKKILMGVLALLIVGGGSAGGALYMTGGLSAHAEEEEDIDPDEPKLVAREGVTDAQASRARRRAGRGRVDSSVFKATYIPIEDQFTSNLRGGTSFVQIGLGLSTYYDEKVVANVEMHKMAIRSSVLSTLSEADPLAITSAEGKNALRAELKRAINGVLDEKEGFGGIDEVYFTSFVTQ